MELRFSCTNPSICLFLFHLQRAYWGFWLEINFIEGDIIIPVTHSHTRTMLCSRPHLTNAYELLNLRDFKISMLNKNYIFQCMGKIFCVEFQRVPFKFRTKCRLREVSRTFAIRHSMANVKSLTFDVWSYLAIKIQLFIFWRGRGHDGFFRRATLFCAK